jgi:hypothetical protein
MIENGYEQMKLNRRLVHDWPKLSWCARVNNHELNVLHGPRVEAREDWIFEGTWTGDFEEGGFDQTVSAVVGTGLRVRNGTVSFATSMNSVDRLYYIEQTNEKIVSNSLACLLAVSGARLAPDCLHSKTLGRYFRDFRGTPLTLPTESGPDIRFLIYDQLVFSYGNLAPRPRVAAAPDFETFEEYHEFLQETVVAIRENLRDPKREFDIAPVATISNGYDSSAAAVVAEPLGIRSALTINRGGVLSHLHDSGEQVAETLGVPIQRTVSTDSGYRDHMLVWAGTGHSYDLNMTLFDFPDDLTLLVVGTHGDIVWQKGLTSEYQESHHFLDRDATGLGLSEWRLHRGMFFAAIPYFGASKLDCLMKINLSSELDPWRVGGSYDRPIPRRIVEQRGVPRTAFGRRKTRTISRPIYYPSDREHRHDLEQFLARRNKKLPLRFGVLQRPIDMIRNQAIGRTGWFNRQDFDDLYFLWANNYLAKNVYTLSAHHLSHECEPCH